MPDARRDDFARGIVNHIKNAVVAGPDSMDATLVCQLFGAMRPRVRRECVDLV